MKKLLLLSILILYGCSKDADSSGSKFRDLHSSVYWASQSGDYAYWLTFSKDYLLKSIYPPDPDRINCEVYFQGDYTDQYYDGHIYSGSNKAIIETENYYSFSMTSTDERGNFYELLMEFEVVDNKLYWTPPSGYFDNDIIEFIPSQGPPSSQGNNCYIVYTL